MYVIHLPDVGTVSADGTGHETGREVEETSDRTWRIRGRKYESGILTRGKTTRIWSDKGVYDLH